MTTKTYTMLATVRGSRDGITVDTFYKGQTYELDAALAEQFYHQGAVTEAGKANPADARETKVVTPKETKDSDAGAHADTGAAIDLTKMTKQQLVAHAKDEHGLDLDEASKKDELIAAIEAAR